LDKLLHVIALLILTGLVFGLIFWFAVIGTIMTISAGVVLAVVLGFIFMCADVYEWW
jgi:hypothetical protein